MYYEFLGFDIRCCPGEYLKGDFNRDYRPYLLRPEVLWPLSVDDYVWPSAFDEFDEAELPSNALRPSVWTWFDLVTMKTFFATQTKVTNMHGVPIAITLVTETSMREADYWGAVLSYRFLLLSDILPEWTFLGYDVADQYKHNGLTNYDCNDQNRAELSTRWAPRLNEYGLFSVLDDAMSFQDLSNQRVRKHAPFYVYGLYREPSGCDESHIE